MKVTNETKVGVLGIIVITLLVLGFNFLKGNKFFVKSMKLHAKYGNVQGLNSSNPVVINGLQVGTVSSINNDENMRELLVTFSLTQNINIPDNSVAIIVPSPLSTTKVEIRLGDSKTFLKNNDNITTEASAGLIDDVMKKVDPVLFEVKTAVNSLDSLLGNVNSVIDANNKRNLSSAIENLNQITASILVSSASLQALLDNENGSLSKTLKNTSSFTGNLAANNDKINGLLTNLNQASNKIAQLDLQKTLSTLDSTIENLKSTISKLNSSEGTVGMLLNDPSIYKNLNATTNKINILLDDVRVHPKRYVSFSLFAKKNKDAPLSAPLSDTDSTIKSIKKEN